MRFREWLEASWCAVGYPVETENLIHGKLGSWFSVLDRLPMDHHAQSNLGDTIHVGNSSQLSVDDGRIIDDAIEMLKPWRKGPLNLFGREIDSEWRSDFKWHRLRDHVDWREKRILDVGSGNGYFGFRALEAGAESVLGIDGYLIHVLQAALVNWFARTRNVVVPLRFTGDSVTGEFDVVLSMGVVYHQRDVDAHLEALFNRCRAGGQLVLESIVANQDFVPKDRYAGMRNVHLIPSVGTLETKLRTVGFCEPKLIDISKTTTDEQRKTRLMPFRSLSDALDPSDRSRTIEGLPAPKRAILIAHRTH